MDAPATLMEQTLLTPVHPTPRSLPRARHPADPTFVLLLPTAPPRPRGYYPAVLSLSLELRAITVDRPSQSELRPTWK